VQKVRSFKCSFLSLETRGTVMRLCVSFKIEKIEGRLRDVVEFVE